jgi:hypothetical protein
MKQGPALPCPACKRSYHSMDWIDANRCRCLKCQDDFEFFPFPALTAAAEVARPQAVAVEEDSTCFFHAENQAEKVCDDCGRFLCAVCAVPFAGKMVCASCIAKARDADVGLIASRVIPGGRALMLAVVPVFVWPVTLLTAPVALYLAITGWKKPQSLVAPGRWKLVIAGLIALVQLGAWGFLGVSLWLMPKH